MAEDIHDVQQSEGNSFIQSSSNLMATYLKLQLSVATVSVTGLATGSALVEEN